MVKLVARWQWLYKSLVYNIKLDFIINNDNIEAIGIEIVTKNGKNILINTQYR